MQELIFSLPKMIPPLEDGGAWVLADDWNVIYKGDTYIIPSGFATDGASIPRFLWRVSGTPLSTPRLFAAIIHDYLYGGGDPEATRLDADTLYRDIQIALGISKWKAYTEYYALRLFGSSHWHQNKKETE